MSKLLSCAILLALLTVTASFARAEKAASVSDLAWMTGSWAGPAGQQTLEENWIQPIGGSIASLVRMTGNGKTSMVELIVIEEENDSLVLRIQQWNPGFAPRTEAPQVMKLDVMAENRVGFRATQAGGMKTLTYSRPSADTFNIDIETDAGAKFQINLKAR
ncbi:MAG: DUF6265 family protein [Pseudomonadales bacterium]|jgi:hypothetical protein|nr:DUF6265 family protein [Pseudomonadales bacterium]MDP7595176.1 DUF6265 family protein [Pseudomonadales bacterium]HJN50181.1 DUF6265 family protein [Pseudomonadales bacterium]|tara:strand:- start:574 stop:1056 length:483 start_codon:yes stop_codon:yes gene_type:complete